MLTSRKFHEQSTREAAVFFRLRRLTKADMLTSRNFDVKSTQEVAVFGGIVA